MVQPSIDKPFAVPSFTYPHLVTYADCTVGNHIYYGRYLELLEAARGAFLRKLGTTFREQQEQDNLFPVIECHLRYKQSARYDDLLQIELWVAVAAGVRLNFACRILNQDDRLILEGQTWHVCTTVAGKPKRLPVALVASLQPFLGAGCASK